MTYQPPLQLEVVIGSDREGRFGPTVADWFAGQAKNRSELTVSTLDLAEFPLPTGLTNRLDPGAAAALAESGSRLERADAFVVVTPEYNHSFPAVLKNALDWHSGRWRAKPVGFVCYGGISGGLRAVEQLRQIFAELHAVTVRDTVSFHGASRQFDEAGQPREAATVNAAAHALLDRLVWWGQALREARAVRPYAG